MQGNSFLAAALLCVLAGPVGAAAPSEFKSGPKQKLFVELYSAESRKIAPAACRWMTGLMETPGLWSEFVPAAFHVDYGLKPGEWKSPYTRKEFTQRLLAHLARWGVSTPFIPTVALNAVEWSGWARGEKFPPQPARQAGMLAVRQSSSDEVLVTFKPAETDHKLWTAHAALLGFGLVSRVDGGENLGKTLRHDFIVLNYNQKPLVRVRDAYRVGVRLPLKAGLRTEAQGLAVWVTKEGGTFPVQCAGGYLLHPKKTPKK